jgi:hypothetical protein
MAIHNKITGIQKKLANGYISRGFNVVYDTNGTTVYLNTENGLIKIDTPIRKKNSKSTKPKAKNKQIEDIIKNGTWKQ